MSTAAYPLYDNRSGTLTWDVVANFASIRLTVQRVLPPVAIRGVEHDLCALFALIEMHLDDVPQVSLIGVQTPLLMVALCCHGRVAPAIERDICERLKRLGRLIDPDASAKVRPTVDYLP
jgi:hypothetical protein